MRVCRVIGLPLLSGAHVNIVPFRVQQLDDITFPISQPSGNAPGAWATQIDFGDIFCINLSDIPACFGRQRKWKARWKMAGDYVPYGGGTPVAFTFDQIIDPTCDVVAPTFEPDERFLPHGRTLFSRFSGSPGVSLTIAGTLGMDYESDGFLLAPGNSPMPMVLFDTLDTVGFTGDFTPINPVVLYSNALDAFYVKFSQSSLTMSVGSGPTYPIQIGFGPNPGSGGGTTYEDISMVFAPFPDVPGTISYPDDRAPTISELIIALQPTDEDAYFEFRDGDGLNPVWDKDDGSQLIIPAPLTQ